ncbi:MAG: hypothetical protein ACK4RM_04325 [Flavobacterium sp.]
MYSIKYFYKLIFILFFTSQTGTAQVLLPFKQRFHSTLNGEMTYIGNQILNRIDKENSPNKPYNDLSHENKPNVFFDLEYIDIDDDPTTFSSSSAALFAKNEDNKSIKYAGLYWIGTYKYESAYKKNDRIISYDDDRLEFHNIKIKFPKKNKYTSIKGEILFDGIKERNTLEQAPYLCYANITEYVNLLDNPFGLYTAANIRGTQGTLEGGTMAGWLIVFVMEDSNLPQKTFYSFDGFASVFNQSHDIQLTDLKNLAYQNTQSEMIAAALGGDNKTGGDMVYLATNTAPTLTNLRTKTRSTGNLFNSTMHILDQPYVSRIPASLNTLGFDVFQTKLESEKDFFVQDETNSLNIRLKSSDDKYYFFFTALSTEHKEEENELPTTFAFGKIKKELEAKIKGEVFDGSDITPYEMRTSSSLTGLNREGTTVGNSQNNTSQSEQKAHIPLELNNKAKNVTINSRTGLDKAEVIQESTSKKEVDIRVLNHPELRKGYFLVANVFSEPVNARQFLNNLRKQGVLADFFVNPANQYYYVYLNYSSSLETATALKLSNLNNTYNGELWLLAVNIAE